MSFWESFGRSFAPYAGKIGSEIGQAIPMLIQGENTNVNKGIMKLGRIPTRNPQFNKYYFNQLFNKSLDDKFSHQKLSKLNPTPGILEPPTQFNIAADNLNTYKALAENKRADFYSGLDKISQKKIRDFININRVNRPKIIKPSKPRIITDRDLPNIWKEQDGQFIETKQKNPFYKPKSTDSFIKKYKNNLMDNAVKINYFQQQLGQPYNAEFDKEYSANPLFQYDINGNLKPFNFKLNHQLGQLTQKSEIIKRILESRIESEMHPQTKEVLNEIENQLNQKFIDKKNEDLQSINNQLTTNFSLNTLVKSNNLENYNLPSNTKAEIVASQYFKIKNQLPHKDYKLINEWFFAKYGKHLIETQAYQNYINNIKKNNE